MSTGYLRLKVPELLAEYNTNLHRASLAGGFNYPTMHRYWQHSEEVRQFHGRSIVGLLLGGLGLTPAQAHNLRFGDVFEIVIDGGEDPDRVDGRGRPPKK